MKHSLDQGRSYVFYIIGTVSCIIILIKCSLGMDILRAKTPAMVHTELWSCLLAYNLIRLKMLQSCASSGRDPRSLSFTTTLQLLGTSWLLCAVIEVTADLAALGQASSSSERVGHRPASPRPRGAAKKQTPTETARAHDKTEARVSR